MKKLFIVIGISLLLLVVFIRLTFGIFVIQPIGAVPEGTSIVYWRVGSDLPFVASADGQLKDSGTGVSLLGRGMMLAKYSQQVNENKILRFKYSKWLYSISTGGSDYSK